MAEDAKDQPVAVDYEKLKKRTAKRIHAPNFVEIYANSMNMEASFHDIKLFFGETMVATQDKLEIEERVSIVMSPEHTLACAKALDKVLKNYVATFGPIRVQPGSDE